MCKYVSIQAYITRQYFATAVCVFDRQSGGGIEVDKGGVKKLPLLIFTTIILIICPWCSSSWWYPTLEICWSVTCLPHVMHTHTHLTGLLVRWIGSSNLDGVPWSHEGTQGAPRRGRGPEAPRLLTSIFKVFRRRKRNFIFDIILKYNALI